MTLDAQIQTLVDNAPQDGTTPVLVEAIAPILKQLASQLRHPQYYIVQTLDQDWVITNIGNRNQPDFEKTVVYAYANLKDVASGPYAMQDPQMMAIPVPVTHILFQMLAMEPIDSIIFFESPGNVDIGTEISRTEMMNLIQSHLSTLKPPTAPPPADIA